MLENTQMKFRKFATAFLLVAAVAAAFSCKKDEDEDITRDYLSGRISLPLPAYMLKGESKTFKLDTIAFLKRADDQKIGYYFKDPATGTYDTLVFDGGVPNPAYPGGVFTITAPDELGSFSSVLTGFSDMYYVTSAVAYFDTVDPRLDGNGSITGFTHLVTDGTFTDPRDSYTYYTVKAAGLEWMRMNLVWDGAGVPYSNAKAMTRVFGRFYSREEAVSACPSGWRLPTDAEWIALASLSASSSVTSGDIPGAAAGIMGDLSFNGNKMWEYWPSVKITNATGLTAIPAGYAMTATSTTSFKGMGSYATFWTSDMEGNLAVYRYIYQDNNTLFRGEADATSFRANVRCVR